MILPGELRLLDDIWSFFLKRYRSVVDHAGPGQVAPLTDELLAEFRSLVHRGTTFEVDILGEAIEIAGVPYAAIEVRDRFGDRVASIELDVSPRVDVSAVTLARYST